MTPKIEALYGAVEAADKAFHAAVVRQFGKKHAGDMRYCSGEHNAETKAAADKYHLAAHKLFEAKDAERANSATVEKLERKANLIALINTYNEASSPSVPRTDEEHKVERERAKIALGSIKRSYTFGVDYKELSNGALWPLAEGSAA